MLTIYFVNKASVNSRLSAAKFWRSQKLYVEFWLQGASRVKCVKLSGKLLDIYYISVPGPEDTAKNENRFLPSFVLIF